MGDQVPYDPGLGLTPGFISPGVPEFALSSGDTPGVAASIAQAGGEVTVDTFGGINMVASSTAFVGIDSFANITINTGITAGAVAIQTFGGGNDVDILNAGRIDFDALGDGALTGVQTINGSVYPPSGSGATTSITQAGALVACLGSGGITISSIGGGVVVDIVNAGNITFDAAGAGAITGLSTINGSAYPPVAPGVISSISGGGATVECDVPSGGIALLTSNPFLTLDAGTVTTTLSAGAGTGNVEVKPNSIILNNPIATVSSIINMKTDGTIDLSGAAVNLINAGSIDFNTGAGIITQLSTVNGVAFVNGSNYVLPANLTVSTLTAASVSTTSLLVSSINNAAFPQAQYVLPANITVSTIAGVSTIEANPNVPFDFLHLGAFDFNISTLGNLTIDSGLGMVLNGVSTINGVEYPVAVKQATYYKSVAQNLTSGTTDITFDLSGAWNNTDGYITHTDGSADFTVVQTGLYQLEFSAIVILNGASWTTSTNKFINISITRSPTAEQAIITQTGLQAVSNYGQSVNSTYYLVAGDVINMSIGNTFTSGPAQAFPLTNTIDLNTFFTWRFIS